MLPQLVSSKTCPFVQRAVILLKEKGVEHEVTYVNLADKPGWFIELSPRGKVPLLRVGDSVLFESQAICEYLDETRGESRLTPTDPIERARDRAFFAFAGEDLFAPIFRSMVASTEATFQEQDAILRERLGRLEQELPGAWLSGSGQQFGLADVAVAPALFRLSLLERRTERRWLEPGSRLGDYARRLVERASVAESVPSDFEAELLRFLRSRQSWLLGEYAL
jgi:glutathione S-transferase